MGLKNTYQARKKFTKTPVKSTGMWYQDGDVVVPSNEITMKGPQGQPNYFNSPILGVGMQSGETKVMQPGEEYLFPNDQSVFETKMQNGGELPEDYEQFKKFQETLPNNLKDSNYKYNDPNSYDLYGMWDASNKPNNFSDVKDSDLFPLQDDGTYHGFSVSPKTGEFLKPKNHPSTWMEVYQAQFNPDLQNQAIIQNEKGRLQYVPRTMQGGGEQLSNFEKIEDVYVNSKKAPWYVRYPRKALRSIDNTLTDFGRQYAKRISDATGGSDWYKQSNPFLNLALESANAPQLAATYAVTGKVQTPSEAMKIENPYGAFVTDALLDPFVVSSAAKAGVKSLPALGKTLTTKTPLKNTYKINPWAFEPNPEAYYHRSPNINNIINRETGMLQGFGESEAGKLFSEAASINPRIGINLKKPANSHLYFAKGTPLDYGRYNSVKKGMSGQGYEGPYLVEVENVPMGASTKGSKPTIEPPKSKESYAVSHRPVSLDEAKFYKEDWLKGYKPIEVPKSKMQMGGMSIPGVNGTVVANTLQQSYNNKKKPKWRK
jgi:hypothetical protein